MHRETRLPRTAPKQIGTPVNPSVGDVAAEIDAGLTWVPDLPTRALEAIVDDYLLRVFGEFEGAIEWRVYLDRRDAREGVARPIASGGLVGTCASIGEGKRLAVIGLAEHVHRSRYGVVVEAKPSKAQGTRTALPVAFKVGDYVRLPAHVAERFHLRGTIHCITEILNETRTGCVLRISGMLPLKGYEVEPWRPVPGERVRKRGNETICVVTNIDDGDRTWPICVAAPGGPGLWCAVSALEPVL